ncbi:expressed unknown protein [Seminavis robusta]|uniref:Uncharacterized protein n=1 Tax=Seminavis robusta TaxID=568900 RepID=A0A9N8DMK0_9STRA|nr:expressed unknown protein [Seminavis robusta]|eukprot:Sro138_g064800.1 n/a (231) ;mRNA; r:69726-70418
MVDSIAEAIRMNNLGAHALVTGEIAGALDTFLVAFRFAPRHAAIVEAAGPDRVVVPTPEQASALGISFLKKEGTPSKLERESEGGSFVYEKPLVFNETVPTSQDGAAVFCAVVVFNIALCFDFMSKHDNVTSIHKTKAMNLYETCIGLFQRTSRLVDLSGSMAAACNNKARICFERGDYESSNRELHRLSGWIDAADQSPTRIDLLEENDFNGMLLNLLLLRAPAIAVAA